LFEIYTALLHVRVASYTSHALPCINTKQVAVKIISKDQQTLYFLEKISTLIDSSFEKKMTNNVQVLTKLYST